MLRGSVQRHAELVGSGGGGGMSHEMTECNEARKGFIHEHYRSAYCTPRTVWAPGTREWGGSGCAAAGLGLTRSLSELNTHVNVKLQF